MFITKLNVVLDNGDSERLIVLCDGEKNQLRMGRIDGSHTTDTGYSIVPRLSETKIKQSYVVYGVTPYRFDSIAALQLMPMNDTAFVNDHDVGGGYGRSTRGFRLNEISLDVARLDSISNDDFNALLGYSLPSSSSSNARQSTTKTISTSSSSSSSSSSSTSTSLELDTNGSTTSLSMSTKPPDSSADTVLVVVLIVCGIIVVFLVLLVLYVVVIRPRQQNKKPLKASKENRENSAEMGKSFVFDSITFFILNFFHIS
jgi:hypothetical protein